MTVETLCKWCDAPTPSELCSPACAEAFAHWRGEGAPVEALCRVPGCKRKVFCRGVCRGDYHVARAVVRSGKKTWAQLEAEGKVLPSRRPGRGPARANAKAFFEGAA